MALRSHESNCLYIYFTVMRCFLDLPPPMQLRAIFEQANCNNSFLVNVKLLSKIQFSYATIQAPLNMLHIKILQI